MNLLSPLLLPYLHLTHPISSYTFHSSHLIPLIPIISFISFIPSYPILSHLIPFHSNDSLSPNLNFIQIFLLRKLKFFYIISTPLLLPYSSYFIPLYLILLKFSCKFEILLISNSLCQKSSCN